MTMVLHGVAFWSQVDPKRPSRQLPPQIRPADLHRSVQIIARQMMAHLVCDAGKPSIAAPGSQMMLRRTSTAAGILFSQRAIRRLKSV